MPTAPSSRRLRGPARIPATKSRIVASSSSRPITLHGVTSDTAAIFRVSCAPPGLGRAGGMPRLLGASSGLAATLSDLDRRAPDSGALTALVRAILGSAHN